MLGKKEEMPGLFIRSFELCQPHTSYFSITFCETV